MSTENFDQIYQYGYTQACNDALDVIAGNYSAAAFSDHPKFIELRDRIKDIKKMGAANQLKTHAVFTEKIRVSSPGGAEQDYVRADLYKDMQLALLEVCQRIEKMLHDTGARG